MATKTDKNNVTMICPNLSCGRTVVALAGMRGQTVRCPYCNSAFRVPGESGAATPPSAPGAKRPR